MLLRFIVFFVVVEREFLPKRDGPRPTGNLLEDLGIFF